MIIVLQRNQKRVCCMYSYVFMYYNIALLKGRHHLPHQGGDSAITENFFYNETHILMNENKNVIVEINC